MKNRIFCRILFIVVCTVILFWGSCIVSTAEISPNVLLTGEYPNPINIILSAPEYNQIAQFGDDRRVLLNKLMKHVGLLISSDGKRLYSAVLLDQKPVIKISDNSENEKTELYEADNSYTGFLENHFFMLNKMLDELYPIFEKTPEAFKEFSKTSSVSLSFRGYGKVVKRLTISLPSQYVSDQFRNTIYGLAENSFIKSFFGSLFFKGPQKIILLYDQNEKLIRINYDGSVGLSDDSMRKISIIWKCLRSEEIKKDDLTFKSPAVKGYDKYNFLYDREMDLTVPGNHILNWNLQTDMRNNQLKKKISYTGDLKSTDNHLTGRISFSDKHDNTETKIIILPALHKEINDVYNGTIEITNISGKIVTSRISFKLRLSSVYEEPAQNPEMFVNQTVMDDETAEHADPEISNSILIRTLLAMPNEDTEFFSTGIPDEIWNELLQLLI